MKKIFIILCCFGILSAHATEMCARDDTVVIPLDATINQTNFYSNGVESLWWAKFDYGTIYGASACLSKKEIMMYNNGTVPASIQAINTASDELIGASGYYMNADVNPDIPDAEKPDYMRGYCVWKLIHPMSSSWIYLRKYGSIGINDVWSCDFNCNTNIGAYTNLSVRIPLFNSIGTTPPWPLD